MSISILRGNALALPIADESVNLVVTSPPYFGLRSYQDGGEHYAGQIGAEATPAEFVDALIAATREMMRVLKPSGSIWVNLGDKYSGYNHGSGKGRSLTGPTRSDARMRDLTAEANARMIDPGFDMMTPDQQKKIVLEVQSVLNKIGSTHGGGKWKQKLLVKDSIADITLQQVLTRPKEFDVIATLNLNGDYLSDALAAQVGGIGIAPGGNVNYVTGHAVFEATHGTAPKYADLDKVNPGSVVLSGEMMLRYMGWTEAADLVLTGMDGAIAGKHVTYDFARLMEGATEVKCSEFGDQIIEKMG